MRITALGVNSAFATGEYLEAIPIARLQEMLETLSSGGDSLSKQRLAQEIRHYAQQLYAPRWQSNFLLEFDMLNKRGTRPYRLLVDVGGDIRHALKDLGLSALDIDGVYISHPHNDHIGGMEYLGLVTLFTPSYTPSKKEWLAGQFIANKLFLEHREWPIPPGNAKPDLFIHRKVLEPLKRAVGPGLDTVQGVPDVRLETYFDIHVIGKQEDGKIVSQIFQDGEHDYWTMTPIFAMHVISSTEEMASYGISLEHSGNYHILMPTDTLYMMPPQLEALYRRANRIYMDCETSAYPSGVHPHISNLIHHLEPEIQKKCLLYHYDAYPNVPTGMFAGILHAGEYHDYPE